MREPRSAAAAGKDFPYRARATCYIEVRADGTLSQGVDAQAYQRAVTGTSPAGGAAAVTATPCAYAAKA